MSKKDHFVFDGVDSRTFNVLLFDKSTSTSPKKDYTVTAIPGRNGDYVMSNKRVANVQQIYDVLIPDRFDENYADLRNFLLSRDGYCKLEDTIHPNEYYMAYFFDVITPILPKRSRDMGKFQLVFNRKPQRWIDSGADEYILRNNSSNVTTTILNPTPYGCYPMLMLTGTAMSSGVTVTVGNNRVSWDNYTGTGYNYMNNTANTLYVDMDSTQTYVKTTDGTIYPINSAVKYIIDTEYPFQLRPGTNNVYVSSNASRVTSLKIIPRWFVL